METIEGSGSLKGAEEGLRAYVNRKELCFDLMFYH